MTYQGYTNYETFIVKVWIDNEQSTREWWLSLARRCLQNAVPSQYLSAQQNAEIELERLLKDSHQAEAERLPMAGVHADLMQAALEEVDWKSLSETLMEEALS